ncbi:MAG: hypothetical protein ACRD0A_21290 [Acidimicrobiales bacterium]
MIKADPIDPAVQGVDDAWLDLMLALRSEAGVEVARLVSPFGNAYLLWPLRFVAGAILAWRRQWLQLSAFVLAVFSSELFIGPLRSWVGRPRPPDPLVLTTSDAYPSGHAIAAAVTSRTYLSAHWLTDVIGGCCFGVALAVVWPAPFELIRAQQALRASPPTADTVEPSG